jgi:hypothetical protein
MDSQDLLQILDSYDRRNLTKMLVFLDQGNSGLRSLGFLEQYDFIESQNTVSVFC